MKDEKLDPFEAELLKGTIVEFSTNRKSKSLSQYKNEELGKPGSKSRDAFELELNMEILQDLIKETRKKKNLSQQQLGELIGVNKAQISKLEKGYSNTTISMISKVFNALGTKIRISIEFEENQLELS
jgi:HTH-type transcriptional regulator/antitoxin HipB